MRKQSKTKFLHNQKVYNYTDLYMIMLGTSIRHSIMNYKKFTKLIKNGVKLSRDQANLFDLEKDFLLGDKDWSLKNKIKEHGLNINYFLIIKSLDCERIEDAIPYNIRNSCRQENNLILSN